MKWIKFLVLLGSVLPFSVQGQQPDTLIDLSVYCPAKYGQYRGTCFAYATVYTAYTIQYCKQNDITDPIDVESQAFSPSFVASMVRKDKSVFKKLFTLWSCSTGGNIEKAASVLQKKGALKMNDFPRECSFRITSGDLAKAATNVIDTFMTVILVDTLTDNQKITLLKNVVSQGHPVICAIHQTSYFSSLTDFYYPTDTPERLGSVDNKVSNHAVCIIGYDSKRGLFLVKNNYTAFGLNGFMWIPCNEFAKYLVYAIQLKLKRNSAL